MREILLKSMLANGDETEFDVMKLHRKELEQKLEEQGIYYEDYMVPVQKEDIIGLMPELQAKAKEYFLFKVGKSMKSNRKGKRRRKKSRKWRNIRNG